MDPNLRHATVHEILAAYSAPAVAPAGISGSALSAAVGASLIVKVARLSERRLPYGPERDKAIVLAGKVERLRNVLEDVVDQDSEAYARLVRIKSALAKGLESDGSLERALKTATIIPGAMGRAALICLSHAADLAELAHQPALPDLCMGSWLCYAAVEASLLAVQQNLGDIPDEAFCQKILGQMSFFDNRAATLDRVLSILTRT